MDRFDIYLRWSKRKSVSILETVNHGCGFFGSSVDKLIRTKMAQVVDGVPNTARRDHMLPVYTFLLPGPGENNRKLLPINGCTRIDKTCAFLTAIL